MKRKSCILPFLTCWFAVCLLSGVVGCGTGSRPNRKVAKELVRSPGNTTYYADSEHGNDQSEGTTPDKAWKSLDRVNGTLFAPGDRILFKAGSRFSGRLAPWGSGMEGAPITVDVFGEGGKPCIEAGGGFHEALLLENEEYWEINNLELTNTGLTHEKFRYGVRVAAWDFGTMRHIHLKNLFVHDVNGSVMKDRGEGHGIVWENGGSTTPSRFDGLLIEACHLLRTDRNGICGYSENSNRDNWFPSLNVVIRNNLLEDIGGDGIKVWGCDGALVEHNRLFGANRRAPDYSAGIWPWSSDRTLIQFNEVSGVTGTRDGEAFDSDGNCQGTVFQYNYSHDNEGGFMLICSAGEWRLPSMVPNTGTVIRYNISQNDRARTFHISGPVKNVSIYNNDFFIGKDLAVPIFLFTDWNGWADGVYAANNVFYAEGRARYSHGTGWDPDGTYPDAPGFGSATSIMFDNNSYYGNHENPPSDPNPMTPDPLLLNPGSGTTGRDSLEGYKLKDGSPCIRTGLLIPDSDGRDFWGNVVESDHPCIGAHYRN
jgi:hypothetical protein